MTLSSLFAAMKPSRAFAPVLGVVTNSAELARICGLPRRVLDFGSVEDVTPLFEKSGQLRFRPIQSAALIEAAKADGLFAPIGVGWGKTLIGLALPEAFDAKNAVYLVRPDLKRQLEREIEDFYGKHFDLPLDRLTIVSYTELSSASKATILEQIEPDAIICDEAHCLRHKTSARTKRFLRYAAEHPACKYAFMSGTMTTRSIHDYGHLIELALRKNSPLPRGYRELSDWAGALDVDPEYRMNPGALKKLCKESEPVRKGFQRRLVQTEGVVATEEGSIGTSLVIRKRRAAIPPEVQAAMATVNKKWVIGDEELTDATEKARVLRQLASGFYYYWVWPNNDPDIEWLDARAAWNKEVRERLKHATEGLDSPYLLARAAERYRQWERKGRPRPKPDKAWDSGAWEAWRRVRDRPPPPTAAVWLSEFLIEDAIAWAKKQDQPAIIWYSSTAIGELLAQRSGFPLFGAATDASDQKADVIIASIRTQGTGKNLQHYSRNLIMELPPNGTTVEQLIGRTHRPGQTSDDVIVDWFGHTEQLEECMTRVLADSEYMEQTTGQRQKVLYAARIN